MVLEQHRSRGFAPGRQIPEAARWRGTAAPPSALHAADRLPVAIQPVCGEPNRSLTLLGKSHGEAQPQRLDQFQVTPAGALSFQLGSDYRFTGFLSGDTISGRHARSHREFGGAWNSEAAKGGGPGT
jgi:hypothetical protein